MPTRSEILDAMHFPHIAAQPAIHGSDEARLVLTYQFAGAAQPEDLPGGVDFATWGTFSQADQDVVRAALSHIETFLNIDFVEVQTQADPDFNFGRPDLQSAVGYAVPSWVTGIGGYWMDSTGAYDGYVLYDTSMDLTTNFNLVLHELGHALGLDHPFDNVTLDDDHDNNHYSVMSYDVDPESLTHNSAMMLYDVFALQDTWGAASFNTGDTTYTGPRTFDVDVIWDSRGTDTLDASARSAAVILDLREGAFSSFGGYEDVAIAFGVRIENARGGAGDDTITGNGLANSLFGGEGADTIDGGGRRDLLVGDSGDDRMAGGGGRDVLLGGAGADALIGGVGNDVLRGGDGFDTLTGGGGRDRLFGGEGDDVLAGGSQTDKLMGGGGADTFHFLFGADRDVVRDFQDGTDTLLFDGFGPLSAVMDAAREQNGHTIFDFGDDVLVVRNIALADLTDDLIVT